MEVVERDSERFGAARNNLPRPSLPNHIGAARLLARKVRAAAAKAKGSNEARPVHLRHGTALQVRFGDPAVFATISPKDNGSLAVSHLACEVDVTRLNDVGLSSLPSQAARFAAKAKDPVAAARYFHRVAKMFFEDIVGYDRKMQQPLARGGVFGVPQAYIAGVETQGDETLLFHAIIWLHGFSRSASEMRAELANQKFSQAFASYADSVHSHTSPLSVHRHCPKCNAPGTELVEVKASSEAYLRGQGSDAPGTARCRKCSARFGYADLIEAALLRGLQALLQRACSRRDIDQELRPLVNLPPA